MQTGTVTVIFVTVMCSECRKGWGKVLALKMVERRLGLSNKDTRAREERRSNHDVVIIITIRMIISVSKSENDYEYRMYECTVALNGGSSTNLTHETHGAKGGCIY